MASPAELDVVERTAIEHMLRGPEAWKSALRAQLSHVGIESRSRNVYGDTVNFSLPLNVRAAENVPSGASPLTCVVKHRLLRHTGLFALWVQAGRLASLEATSHGDEPWPSHSPAEHFEFE